MISSQYNIERGLFNRKDRSAEELSAQYIVDCGGDKAAYGCKGGRPVMVMRHLQASDGVPYESCYRYKAQAGRCNEEAARKCCQRKKVKWSQLIDVSGPREKEIVAKLLNWGPMVAIVGASQTWQFYNGTGIIKAHQCDPKQQNHAVVVAGYDFSGPTPFYYIKNSWGTDWGTQGFTKLEAGKNACNVAKSLLITCTGDCRNVKHVKDLIHRADHFERKPKLEKSEKKRVSGTTTVKPTLSTAKPTTKNQQTTTKNSFRGYPRKKPGR